MTFLFISVASLSIGTQFLIIGVLGLFIGAVFLRSRRSRHRNGRKSSNRGDGGYVGACDEHNSCESADNVGGDGGGDAGCGGDGGGGD